MLRFLSGGADSALASYEVRVYRRGEGGEEEDEQDKEEKESNDACSCSSRSSMMTLRAGPAAKLPSRGVGALAVSQRVSEETLIAVGGWDGTIRLLALKREEEEGEENGDEEQEQQEQRQSGDGSPPFTRLEPLGELEHHVAPVASLCFGTSPVEGELLASGGRDGSIALWAGLV